MNMRTAATFVWARKRYARFRIWDLGFGISDLSLVIWSQHQFDGVLYRLAGLLEQDVLGSGADVNR